MTGMIFILHNHKLKTKHILTRQKHIHSPVNQEMYTTRVSHIIQFSFAKFVIFEPYET